MPSTAIGFGGGKIILVGEHAVVHGVPAIAAGIRRGTIETDFQGLVLGPKPPIRVRYRRRAGSQRHS